MLVRSLLLAVALLGGGAAAAQQEPIPAPVLIIDSERLYLESGYGQAIRAELDAAALALQAENERIQTQLIEEEQSLSERRHSMEVDAFRAAAEEFDARVQDIRQARDAKIAELEQARAAGRDQFFEDTRGIVGGLMLERGAVVLLDRRSVFLAVGSADITAEAIARIDETLLTDAPPDDGTPPQDSDAAEGNP